MTVEQIQSAIAKLTPAQLADLKAWFAEFDGNSWDQQIEDDIQSGRLDALANEALDELQAGETTKL